MRQHTRGKFTALKLSQIATGGGPPAQPLTELEQRIIDILGESPSFAGVDGGIDTSLLQSTHASPPASLSEPPRAPSALLEACERGVLQEVVPSVSQGKKRKAEDPGIQQLLNHQSNIMEQQQHIIE